MKRRVGREVRSVRKKFIVVEKKGGGWKGEIRLDGMDVEV